MNIIQSNVPFLIVSYFSFSEELFLVFDLIVEAYTSVDITLVVNAKVVIISGKYCIEQDSEDSCDSQ